MIGTLGATLLREIPEVLLQGVTSGEFKVYGSIIRSLDSGRIVGHLQETSGMAKIAGQLLTAPASMPLQGIGMAVDIAGHAASYANTEKLKAAVAVVQHLQVAELAMGVAGIGVSVAGFAVLSHKINRVETKVEALGERLDAIARNIEALRADRVAELFTRLRTAVEQLDEGWSLTDPASQWRGVATDTHALANSFRRQADEILSRPATDIAVAEPFLEALALAQSTRVTARLAAGDDLVARRAAAENAEVLGEIGGRLKVGELALARLDEGTVPIGTPAWGEALKNTTGRVRESVRNIRAREIAAHGTAATLDELERQGISGREWLQAARSELESPLLLLQARDGVGLV